MKIKIIVGRLLKGQQLPSTWVAMADRFEFDFKTVEEAKSAFMRMKENRKILEARSGFTKGYRYGLFLITYEDNPNKFETLLWHHTKPEF